jgi:hypothetical protein
MIDSSGENDIRVIAGKTVETRVSILYVEDCVIGMSDSCENQTVYIQVKNDPPFIRDKEGSQVDINKYLNIQHNFDFYDVINVPDIYDPENSRVQLYQLNDYKGLYNKSFDAFDA